MPVLPLTQWNGDFSIDEVRVQKGRLNHSSVSPPVTFVTGRCKVSNTDSDNRWVEVQLSRAEREKLQEIEERILRMQPDSMKFRGSLDQQGRLEMWLDPETEYYSAERELLEERPEIAVGTVVRAVVTLSELSYARTEFGALWRVEQLFTPRAKLAFDHDDDDDKTADDAPEAAEPAAEPEAEPEADLIDLKLPGRGGNDD